MKITILFNFHGKYSKNFSWNWFIWFHEFFCPELLNFLANCARVGHMGPGWALGPRNGHFGSEWALGTRVLESGPITRTNLTTNKSWAESTPIKSRIYNKVWHSQTFDSNFLHATAIHLSYYIFNLFILMYFFQLILKFLQYTNWAILDPKVTKYLPFFGHQLMIFFVYKLEKSSELVKKNQHF